MIMIYLPCKNKTEAKKIAANLIKKKLIACANIVQSDSIYNWKNRLYNDKESILLLKAKRTDERQIRQEIKKLHSYELPAIITINAKANKEFENWVDKQR
jgi:periplasmic divalent cation tolerance protein